MALSSSCRNSTYAFSISSQPSSSKYGLKLPISQLKYLSPSRSISCVMTGDPPVQTEEKKREIGVSERPNLFGKFGKFGGKFVPETLIYALGELELAFRSIAGDEEFQKEVDGMLRDYVGRETPLYFAERLTNHYKRSNGEGPKIYLKREDLNHTGSHKINNAIAQVMLAKRLGKKRIIAETGAGQHGVATATCCARFGLECVVYMGAQDMERQPLNVMKMRLLGAEEGSASERHIYIKSGARGAATPLSCGDKYTSTGDVDICFRRLLPSQQHRQGGPQCFQASISTGGYNPGTRDIPCFSLLGEVVPHLAGFYKGGG